MWLGFQVVEKQGDAEQDKENTFAEFTLIGWTFIELIGSRGEIAIGRQVQ
jgi:hypothetical protein